MGKQPTQNYREQEKSRKHSITKRYNPTSELKGIESYNIVDKESK